MDIQQQLHSLAMLGARWVLWALIALSVIGVAVIAERAIYYLSSRDDVAELRKQLLELLGRGQLGLARKRLQASRSFEASIAVAGLDSEGAAEAEERMAGATQLARLKMERYLVYLGTLGNNAPFVGLLGTVIGIIGAFQELNRNAAQVSTGLMAEIGEALIATAAGIFVALPAVACFNLFQRVIEARLQRADVLGRAVVAYHRRATERAGRPSLTDVGPLSGPLED